VEGACSYIGCIGKDKFGVQLRKSAESDNVRVHYLEDEKTPTGTCACLIMNKERSLIANLAAANKYKIDHLKTEQIRKVWEAARIIYSAGFFLTVSPESALMLAEHCNASNKIYATNLSALFICQFFSKPLLDVLPYTDYIFGNESEAEAFGKQQNYADVSTENVALKLAAWSKKNESRPRVAVITQGSQATLVATEGKLLKFDVPKLEHDKIVDCNGAGDSFVGGFLSQLAQKKPLEACVAAGHYAARVILQVSGVVLKGKPSYP